MVEEFIPIAVFIAAVLIISVITYFRYKSHQAVQQTIQAAMEKGHELSPELLDKLAGPKKVTASNLRRGIISLAIGIAFALFGVILGEEDAIRPMIAIGMFPAMIGVAYLILWRTGDREQQS
jgi:preprotein translocase subunit YajC